MKKVPIETLEHRVECMNPICEEQITEGQRVISTGELYVHKGQCCKLVESTETTVLWGAREVEIKYAGNT